MTALRRIGAAAIAALALLTPTASAATPTAMEFSTGISPNSGPYGITTGPDGNLWFTERIGDRVARITPGGAVTEFSMGISGANAHDIAAGPDGNLWFTDFGHGRVDRMTTAGVVTEFDVTGGSALVVPVGIASGPDGNLWYAIAGERDVGKITPAGGFTHYSTGITGSPGDIAAGPDGNLWFTEPGSHRVGRITPAGSVNEFTTGISPGSELEDIALGGDGNLWFAGGGSSGFRIGRITPTGTITEFKTGISAGTHGITAGPDGNLWFTVPTEDRIGRITPGGAVTEFSAGITPGSGLRSIVAGPDGNLWFTEQDGNRVGRINTGLDPPAFQNTTPIKVPQDPATSPGPGSPYPSAIEVSGIPGPITNVRVRLTGISHSFPDDLDVMLVGPQGQRAFLIGDAGEQLGVQGTTLTFDDTAVFVPRDGLGLVSGIFTPANYGGGDSFLSLPAPPHPTSLSVFNGTNANGTWRLYVEDDSPNDFGIIHGGWGLDINPPVPPPQQPPAQQPDPQPQPQPDPQPDPSPLLPAFGPDTKLSVGLDSKRSTRKVLAVKLVNRNTFAVGGTVGGKTSKKLRLGAAASRVALKAKAFSLGAGKSTVIRLSLPSKARTELRRRRRLKLGVVATLRDPAGTERRVTKTVTLKLKKRRST